MTATVATTADVWGRHICTQQARLLATRQTTAAKAAARIVHAIHLQAGLTPPTQTAPKGTP